jgi:hypothetical protein
MKRKVIFIIMIITIILQMLSTLSKVKAYDLNIPIDRENIIFYGNMTNDRNGTATATVKTSDKIKNYNLSYQHIFVTKDVVIKINDISNNYNRKLKELSDKEENIIKKFESDKNKFNEKVEKGTSTEEERKKLEEEQRNSQAEIHKIGDEYKKILKELDSEIIKTLPQFDDAAWKSIAQTNQNIAIKNVSSEVKSVLIWVKATGNSETLYSFRIFDVDANKLNKDNTNEVNFNNKNESNSNNANKYPNIKMEYIYENRIPKIKISGLENVKDNKYVIYISGEKKQVTNEDLKNFQSNNKEIVKIENDEYKWYSDKLIELLEKGQDIYMSIVTLKKDKSSEIEDIVIDQYKMAEYPYYFKDYRAFQYSNINNSFYQIITNFVSNNKNARKAKIKIGKITDDTILNKYKQNPIPTTDELISFAKKDSGIFNNVLSEDDTFYNMSFEKRTQLFDGINKLERGKYYYIYLSTDDEDGKYKHQEAITIAQANNMIEKLNIWDLFLYGDEKFKWSEETITNDNTTAKGRLPQTGESYLSYISVTGIFATLGILTYKIYRKNKF